jgi:putative ABC transport system substrate-binding protein
MRQARFRLIVALALCVLLTPLAAEAQRAGKIPRVGVLGVTSPASGGQLLDAFREGLREVGRVEGRSLVLEVRWAEGRLDRLPELAADLLRLQVDLIVTTCGPPLTAIRQASLTIPVVIAACGDPDSFRGEIASLARPGGNTTGLTLLAPELGGKRLQLLKEAVPRVSRPAFLISTMAVPYSDVLWRSMQAAATSLGVHLQSFELRGRDDFERVAAEIVKARRDGLIVVLDPLMFLLRHRIVEFASANKLPAIHEIREFAEAGGMMAYGPHLPDLFRRAAVFVDKILKGAKPGDLPVEQATKFELVINTKTAKALGLALPSSMLFRADHVIE